MAVQSKHRQASIERVGKGNDASWKGVCPACIAKTRRGAIAKFKGADSGGRNGWWDRHKNHHLLEDTGNGLRF